MISAGDTRAATRTIRGNRPLATPKVARQAIPARFPPPIKALPPMQAGVASQADQDEFCRELEKVIVSAPRHRAGGPGGGRYEHWHFQTVFPADWAAVRAPMLRIAIGNAPVDVITAVAGAFITPSAKGEQDARPLTRGMITRRLITRTVAKVFKARVELATAPYQYALGHSAGAEAMHKAIQCGLAMDSN
eukprot:10104053-Alexandrium_andersonii.AAC.1